MNKVIQAKFEYVPKTKDTTPQKKFDEVFGNMIGHKYNVYLSEFTGEYVIFSGVDEEAEIEIKGNILKAPESFYKKENWEETIKQLSDCMSKSMMTPNEAREILIKWVKS